MSQPFNPQMIAREAAQQIMALNYPTTPAIDNLSGIVLTAAAKMVRESGAVEALLSCSPMADYPSEEWSRLSDNKQAAIAALRSIGTP